MTATKRILVLYYTQTGQLKEVLENMFRTVAGDVTLVWTPIEPVQPFAFPWTQERFFDTMPETVQQVAVPLKPLDPAVLQQDYDLVVFGMQPWFLHPSLPVSSFLQSQEAALLHGKKVVTVVGSRNMWLNAIEKVKGAFQQLGAEHVGNIVLRDKHPNLLSLKTIDRWMFKGIKAAGDGLPEAGISQADIKDAARFGPVLLGAMIQNDWKELQEKILAADGLTLNTGLVLLEQRGVKNFRFWARYIREKGGPGALERQARVKKFMWLLNVGVRILSPITALSGAVQLQLKKQKLNEDVAYFKSVRYEAGRI